VRSPRQVLAAWFVREITRPRREYRRFVFNDAHRLKSRIRPGDVVLVDGDQRISQVVKYLTMSPWSHTAIYIGSALVRDPASRPDTRKRFGGEARYLVVEALVDQGVVVSPLIKYIDFNIRICRPHGLTREQVETVVDHVLSRVGFTYDRRNIFDLFRYLLPLRLVPMRLREEALHFGSGIETETICSSLLAEAFEGVGHPILPVRIRRKAQSGFLKTSHPTLCVPQDFDLSPYFDVVKFNAREPIEFGWVRQE
jgi:hypothetical protein